MNELRLAIPRKLEEDYHKFLLSECKNEEAVRMENLRHMFKLKVIESREKEIEMEI